MFAPQAGSVAVLVFPCSLRRYRMLETHHILAESVSTFTTKVTVTSESGDKDRRAELVPIQFSELQLSVRTFWEVRVDLLPQSPTQKSLATYG